MPTLSQSTSAQYAAAVVSARAPGQKRTIMPTSHSYVSPMLTQQGSTWSNPPGGDIDSDSEHGVETNVKDVSRVNEHAGSAGGPWVDSTDTSKHVSVV